MKVARLRKAARLSSPKSYVATAEGGCANPWLSRGPYPAKAAWHEVPGKKIKVDAPFFFFPVPVLTSY
jgi:hypothetical protein